MISCRFYLLEIATFLLHNFTRTETKNTLIPVLFFRDCTSRRRKSTSLLVNLWLHRTTKTGLA